MTNKENKLEKYRKEKNNLILLFSIDEVEFSQIGLMVLFL